MWRPQAPRPLAFVAAVVLAGASSAGCSPGSRQPQRRYGDVMADVGRRFERAGRAVEVGRWELASYDATELMEAFEDDLPAAHPPAEARADVKALAAAFSPIWPPQLMRAIDSRDPAAVKAAFVKVSEACNACHQAAGFSFVVVPGVPARGVPEVGPLPPPAPPAK